MKNVKVFTGNDEQVAKDLGAFYNRQGKMGNRIENAKLHIMPDGSIKATVIWSGKEDDGRDLEGIEARKAFGIFRILDGDTENAAIADFYEQYSVENNYSINTPFVTTTEKDILFFIVATKIPVAATSDYDDDDEDEDDADPVFDTIIDGDDSPF